MQYTKFQKILSGVLIFSLLFSITFHIPLSLIGGKALASDKPFYNLVSVLVQEDIYNEVKSKVQRYASDVQSHLENTKVVIIPTPNDANPFAIASLNESLYFDGYKSLQPNTDFESKLVGTVFVGNFPLPIASEGNNFSKSILPYVDFEDKGYIFNHKTGVYERDAQSTKDVKADIWHGFITSNTGDSNKDIQNINAYFDKDHDFYQGTGLFTSAKGIINQKNGEATTSSYDPAVFYFDEFRENNALSLQKYGGYEAYLQNIEDISYNRYSKELAEKIKNQVLGGQTADIQDLIKKLDPSIDVSTLSSGPDVTKTSDVSTRYIVQNATNKFLGIFNDSALGEMRKYVYNAGRYNGESGGINADFIPVLISTLDLVSQQVVKNANNQLEEQINNYVTGGLMRDIGLPVSITSSPSSCSQTYQNFLYGKNAADIKNASECSIYRGSLDNSGTLAEANRGYNINLIQGDYNTCRFGDTTGYWGGNSPANLDQTQLSNMKFVLKSHDITGAIVPLFDVSAAKGSSDATKVPSPLNCYDTNYLLAQRNDLHTSGGSEGGVSTCELGYQIPTFGTAMGWTCATNNSHGTVSTTKFEDVYKSFNSLAMSECTTLTLMLGTKQIKQKTNYIPYNAGGESGPSGCAYHNIETYQYNPITSQVTHTSPTNDELGTQIQSKIAESLPIDKDRYIDYITAKGDYQKIVYPQLFRIHLSDTSSVADYDVAVKKELDDISKNINAARVSGDPSSLSGKDKELYDLLKVADYPATPIDLYGFLKNKPLKVYTLNGEEKKISYLDTLLFSLYWVHLNSPSAKYKFIFENYLSDQFGGNNLNFELPKNKKVYESAYLGAPGDGKNMYIKLDPNDKDTNPYANIISQNTLLNTSLLAYNASAGKNNNDEKFKCGPPDGVPIWEWIPAIICRLKDMLPPKIGISQGQCGSSLFTEKEIDDLQQCDQDVNKNGINDCTEKSLDAGSIELQSDASKYLYNTSGEMRATLKDSSGTPIKFDNTTNIQFQLVKIEKPKDSAKVFDDTNTELVYDAQHETDASVKEVANYVYFKSISIRAESGEAQNLFSVKNKDANLYFKALVSIKDSNGVEKISLSSHELKVEIRGDNLFATGYKIDSSTGTSTLLTSADSVKVSDTQNIFLIDENKQDPENLAAKINTHSSAQEKVILGLSNYSKTNNRLDINYPLNLKVQLNGETFEEYNLQENQFAQYVPLHGYKKSGNYTFVFTDADRNTFSKQVTLLPEVAVKGQIQLGSSIIESGGAISTSAFTLLDKFDNVADGDVYSVDADTNSSALLFYENTDQSLSFQTIEGYRAFRLKSTDKTGTSKLSFTVYDASKSKLFTMSSDIRVIDKIQLDIRKLQPEVKVGGGKYSLSVTLRDDNGNKISDFNSRIYFSIPDTYGTSDQSYFDIKNGEGTVTYITKNVASRGVKLQFQVEGLKNIAERTVDILPEKPVKLDLQISNSKLEANPSQSTKVRVLLKDRYGNLVFTDSSSNINMEVLPAYSDIITVDTPSVTLSEGIADFGVHATSMPGSAYFKVSITPTLDGNTLYVDGQSPFIKSDLVIPGFVDSNGMTDLGRKFFYEFSSTMYMSRFSTLASLQSSTNYLAQSTSIQNRLSEFYLKNNTIKIEPVSQNAGKIETYYFWNKDNILGKKYNALYTTLLGSSYGDVTQKDYLAGSLIFDSSNRALAVTSLLNNPNKYNDVITISPDGKVLPVYNTKDITQSLTFSVDTDDSGRLTIQSSNQALGNHIGDVIYDFDPGKLFVGECSGSDETMDDCVVSEGKTSVMLRSLDNSYRVALENSGFSLKNSFDQSVFAFSKDGFFTKNANVYLTSDSVGEKYAQFNVHTGNKVIATFLVHFVGANITGYTNKQILDSFLDKVKNQIYYYHASQLYSTRDIFNGKAHTLAIYYQDPFTNDFTLDTFSQENVNGYENFYKQAGLGRQSENKTLLSFSAGKSVGESVRDYQTFSVINIGDPVVSLKTLKKKLPGTSKDRSFDSGIGNIITRDSENVAYKTFDYNNDNKKDIIVIKKNGYISLFENSDTGQRYRDLGNLVYAVDFGSSNLIATGDFTGDGYDDIFFVNKDGKPYLFNNVGKNFTRYSLVDNFALDAKVIQVRTFDMDHDGKDDIVTLDDSGQIHIFYGGGTSENPTFTKLLIGNGYGIDLNSSARNDNALVYFDGMYQLPQDGDNSDLLSSNEKYLAEFQKSLSGSNAGLSSDINEYFLDNYIFTRLSYSTGAQTGENIYSQDTLNNAIDSINVQNGTDVTDAVNTTKQDLTNFVDEYGNYISYDTGSTSLSESINNTQGKTTFMKSEFSEAEGLKVEKVFRDLNGGTLRSGDAVNVQITLINTTNHALKNVAYVETLDKYFRLDTDVAMQSLFGLTPRQISGYDFIVDGFTLPKNGSTTFNYQVKTLPFTYGYIQAGLFEQGEAGDDEYGDVIVRPDDKNCGELVNIYRSTAVRSYQKGQKAPVCSKKLSEDQNLKDTNGNGIPDYLDNIYSSIEAYKKKTETDLSTKFENPDELATLLNQMSKDSDGDGIPDQEDTTPTYDDSQSDSDGDFLDQINAITDAISKKIDFITKGLSCGFGGGACIASPLNWAPLAPGSAPTLFGFPLGIMSPSTGFPVFSGLTGMPMMCGHSPCCIPTTYPASPLAFIPGPTCGAPSAGGYLGTWAPTNTFRFYITPTITGAVGIAACFGGPAIVAGFSNPPGLHPIVPGGNCVVAAMPLLGCKDDGSDGEITSVGPPSYSGSYLIYNGNCPTDSYSYKKKQSTSTGVLTEDTTKDYITYKKTGVKSPTLGERLAKVFSTIAKGNPNAINPFNQPLINLEGGGSQDMSLSVNINPSALSSGNASDVIQVKMSRVMAFPDFLMDWVTRQIEEIVTKLTTLPTLQIILPDFSGIMDDRWMNFSENIRKAYESGKAKEQQKQSATDSRVSSLQAQKSGLDCSGKDSIRCVSIDLQVSKLRAQRGFSLRSISGINEVYQFMSNLPLIALQPATVSVNIPWVDATTLNRAILDWQMTLAQRQDELNRVTSIRSNASSKCAGMSDASAKSACMAQSAIQDTAKVNARKFFSSLERNIQTLKEYKDIPKKINDLLGKKEVRLEQILCNIETISKLMGGWIGKNGKRFQTWVELYVLIKAILKSWQLLIDVFTDYEASCHQCKNERHDLMYFIMKLINMIIPKIPIIQFPKWPDIILDLHNVRAGMTVYIPDIKINLRPLVLPSLPRLTLPSVPTINLNLPALPQLPRIVIPELPDLPSLPTIKLPDLPPPPKIPKLFAALEGILNILKLVTKIMCILKMSPFVPEWRAGDQIAFITERQGYLPIDFLSLSLPQFSYPFVDAIKVTTYVNLEFDNQFIVEMVRQILAPLNSFSNNIANKINWNIKDINLEEAVPSNININVKTSTKDPVDVKTSYIGKSFSTNIALLVSKNIKVLIAYVQLNKDITVDSKEFIKTIGENLASKSFTADPRLAKVQQVWKDALAYDYAKEQALTDSLLKNNTEKFQVLKDIVQTELTNTKLQRKQLEKVEQAPSIVKVSLVNNTLDIAGYQAKLEPYNQKTLQALDAVLSPDLTEKNAIQAQGQDIISRVSGGIDAFKRGEQNNIDTIKSETNTSTSSTSSTSDKKLLADTTNENAAYTSTLTNSCALNPDADKYIYKGMYIVEDGVSYRLFDYLDELKGDEEGTHIDTNNDGDEDILYMVGDTLYQKENLEKTDTKHYVTDTPLFVRVSENKFFVNDLSYIESVNGLKESAVNDGYINVSFYGPLRDDVNNFRLQFYPIVDKLYSLVFNDYFPADIQKHVIDAFDNIDSTTISKDNDTYTIRNNLVRMSHIGTVPGYKVETPELKNLALDIQEGKVVNLNPNTKVYAKDASVELTYTMNGTEEEHTIVLVANTNLAFKQTIKIIAINGEAFVATGRTRIYDLGDDILTLIGLPLLPGTKIYHEGGKSLTDSANITLSYYDGSSYDVDMREVENYTVYDLGVQSSNYLVRTEVPNDFYYLRMNSWRGDVVSNTSKQILLSPQREADTNPPSLDLNQGIRIPVYQKQLFDFTPYIYEDSGIKNIDDFYIDFNLDKDSDDDKNPKNDRDMPNMTVLKSNTAIKVDFGPYDDTFTKKIGIYLKDKNGNVGYKEVNFEVYAPVPTIQSDDKITLKGFINETLNEEPVNIYRVRNGILSKLIDTSDKQKVLTNTGGNYDFTTKDGTGLTLNEDGKTVAFIDEFNGGIKIFNPIYNVTVTPSEKVGSQDIYPQIILNRGADEIYRQSFNFSKNSGVKLVENLSDAIQIGMNFVFFNKENYGYYYIPDGVPFNPGAFAIYDTSLGRDTPVFTVLLDGRIFTASDKYQLKYESYFGKVLLDFVDTTKDITIGKMLLNPDGNFVIK